MTQSQPKSTFIPWKVLSILSFLASLLYVYPVWRLGSWLEQSWQLVTAIALLLFASQFIARFWLKNRISAIAYTIRRSADIFLGIAPIMLICVLVGEIFVAIGFNAVGVGLVAFITILTLSLWGIYKAWHPQVVGIALQSPKITKPLRFVQISDVHIGSRTIKFLNNVMQTVESLDADFLCITGDFIDQPGISVEQLASLKNYTKPIYFCIGNHERYEDLDAIVQRLESIGVEVLRSRSLLVDELQVIGIDDAEDHQQVAKELRRIDVDSNQYSILLYHRPRGLQDAAEKGIDLMLSGHTHNGQIVPFNYVVNRVFEYRKGLYKQGNTRLYVNEGTGTWGPLMRLGTRCEITLFELDPED